MTATEILDELARRGARVRLDGDKIDVKPATAIDPAIRAAAAKVRPDLVRLLRDTQPAEPSRSPRTLAVAAVFSRINAEVPGAASLHGRVRADGRLAARVRHAEGELDRAAGADDGTFARALVDFEAAWRGALQAAAAAGRIA